MRTCACGPSRIRACVRGSREQAGTKDARIRTYAYAPNRILACEHTRTRAGEQASRQANERMNEQINKHTNALTRSNIHTRGAQSVCVRPRASRIHRRVLAHTGRSQIRCDEARMRVCTSAFMRVCTYARRRRRRCVLIDDLRSCVYADACMRRMVAMFIM
jgi:hypothetical protein